MGIRGFVFLSGMAILTVGALAGNSPPPYGIVVIDWLQSKPLTDAAIYPSVHPSVEFTANGPGVGYTVWPRTSGNQQVKIRFLNPTSTAHTATLTITGAGYTTALGTTSLSVTPTSSQISFPAAGEAEKTLTISGLPNYVAKGGLEITFTLIGDTGGTSLGGGVGTTLYQTESAPIGIQNPVWRDVLDDACVWALGEQGANACRWATTTSLYFSGVFSYYPPTPVYTEEQTADEVGVRHYRFYLRQFFADRPVIVPHLLGDCQDVSNYLGITWKALGVEGTALQFFPAPNLNNPDPTKFRTQSVAPIGTDPDYSPNYVTYEFQFHQTAFVLSELSAFDVTLAHQFDPNATPYYRPAKQWYYDDYFQTSVSPYVIYMGGFSNFVGLAREYKNYPTMFGETVGLESIEAVLVGYADSPTD